jgi:hypothetical protein
MGRKIWLLFFMLNSTFLFSMLAQNFKLDWSTIDGGGGTSTGGIYTLTGTIGQPEAGQMSGGKFTLVGGFWGVVAAIQTPGAPLLSVWRTAANRVIVSWPAPADGWLLHSTTNLVAPGSGWTEIPFPYLTNGTNISFTEPLPVGNKFYQLHKP